MSFINLISGDSSRILRTAAYCRVSTLYEEQALSFNTQQDYYKNLITANQLMSFSGIYSDHGISGLHTDNRTDFCRMMADCRAGKLDLIITYSVSRFSRNLNDCISSISELKSYGVDIIFEKENICTKNSNCELMLHILAALAQEEINSLSQSIRWACYRRAELGDPIRIAPYGYRRASFANPLSGIHEWTINLSEGKHIHLIFQMALEYRPYSEIISVLNSKVPHISWSTQRIRRILQNEAYCGDLLAYKHYTTDYLSHKLKKNDGAFQQYYIENHHPGIITKSEYLKVQQILKSGILNSKLTPAARQKRISSLNIER